MVTFSEKRAKKSWFTLMGEVRLSVHSPHRTLLAAEDVNNAAAALCHNHLAVNWIMRHDVCFGGHGAQRCTIDRVDMHEDCAVESDHNTYD